MSAPLDFPVPPACSVCSGRRWIVEEGRARRCECAQSIPGSNLIERAGLPPRYRDCRLETFKPEVASGSAREQLARARSICRQYIDEFLEADGLFRETGLIFIGPPGVGKTHLAAAVLRELIEQYRVDGRFVDFTSLLHEIQATFDSSSPITKNAVLRPVTNAEVLVLDELGAQKPTPWVSEMLYLIMNARYSRRLPTLFTTNFRLDPEAEEQGLDRGADQTASLHRRIPAPLLSRLYEMARPVVLDGAPDFRRQIQVHQHGI